jgi:NADH-quinone oxidoreductase subunit N
LLLIGVMNSGIGAYYYLRIIVAMYMREARKEVPVTPISFGLGAALAITVIATLYLGLFPDRVLGYARQSAQELMLQSSPPAPSNANDTTHPTSISRVEPR